MDQEIIESLLTTKAKNSFVAPVAKQQNLRLCEFNTAETQELKVEEISFYDVDLRGSLDKEMEQYMHKRLQRIQEMS